MLLLLPQAFFIAQDAYGPMVLLYLIHWDALPNSFLSIQQYLYINTKAQKQKHPDFILPFL